MAYQMAAMAVTLNDLEGHSRFTSCRPLQMQFVEHLCSILNDFKIFNWQYSHSFSALAELFVLDGITEGYMPSTVIKM